MKKYVSILLTFVMIITVTSCANVQKSNWQEHLDLGQKYLLDGDYEQAIIEFNKVIEIEPKNADAYLGLAEAYVAAGDYDSAISVLERVYEDTENQVFQDRINELKDLSATRTDVSLTTPEVIDVSNPNAEVITNAKQVKTFIYGIATEERYTYDEIGKCIEFLITDYCVPNFQIIFLYDNNGKVDKAILYQLSISDSYNVDLIMPLGITSIDTKDVEYSDAGDLKLSFETPFDSFYTHRVFEFEFSKQMYLEKSYYYYDFGAYSISHTMTISRDESGKAALITATSSNEGLEEIYQYEATMLYDENDMPMCCSLLYNGNVDAVFEVLYYFEDEQLKNITESYPNSDISSIYTLNYNEGKLINFHYNFNNIDYISEFDMEFEYDSDGRLIKILNPFLTTSLLSSFAEGYIEYEYVPYMQLKSFRIPSKYNRAFLDTCYVYDGETYSVEILKTELTPFGRESHISELYLNTAKLTESEDYAISGDAIVLHESAFKKAYIPEAIGSYAMQAILLNEETGVMQSSNLIGITLII